MPTPPEAAPGDWITLTWRTSGGEPHLFRVDESGLPKPESSDYLGPSGTMEVPIEGGPGGQVTFALGLLAPDRGEWLETATLTIPIREAALPPLELPEPVPARPTPEPSSCPAAACVRWTHLQQRFR